MFLASILVCVSKNKVKLLHQILAGNLLSISKSLGYVVLSQIKVRTKVSPLKVYLNRYTPQLCCDWDKAQSNPLLSVGTSG
jgi:hypothetical protein